jgi:hypothetical protein
MFTVRSCRKPAINVCAFRPSGNVTLSTASRNEYDPAYDNSQAHVKSDRNRSGTNTPILVVQHARPASVELVVFGPSQEPVDDVREERKEP